MPVLSHKYLMALSSCFSISEEQKLFVLTSDIFSSVQSGVTHLLSSFHQLNKVALANFSCMSVVTLGVTCEFVAGPDKLCRNVPDVALTEMDCSGRRRVQESAEVS